MIEPEIFWALTIDMVALSIIGPERLMRMWLMIKAPIHWLFTRGD
jgi:hypothetical protein